MNSTGAADRRNVKSCSLGRQVAARVMTVGSTPLPAAPSARLAACLPSREDDGLTTLHRRNPRGLGPALTPVARHLRRMSLPHPDRATYRFGPSLSAPWACLCLRRLQRFTWVGHTTRPWSPTAAVLAVTISSRAP